jgi:thiamine pyrophosphate-dependent acetolactate synthase large subunit-like protein
MDFSNDYEMTQPAAKLMNLCRESDVMTDGQFMVQYNSLSTTAKKQLLTIVAINNHQTTCTFPCSGFTLST